MGVIVGKAGPSHTSAPPAAFPQWEREVTALLAAAVASAPDRDKLAKMNAWLAEHPWHDKATERERQRWEQFELVRKAENALADRCERIARLQERLTPAQRSGIAALIGYELVPFVAQAWAIAARRTGATDLVSAAETARGLIEGWQNEDGDLISWVRFWDEARARGFETRAELEPTIGPLGADPQDAWNRLIGRDARREAA